MNLYLTLLLFNLFSEKEEEIIKILLSFCKIRICKYFMLFIHMHKVVLNKTNVLVIYYTKNYHMLEFDIFYIYYCAM